VYSRNRRIFAWFSFQVGLDSQHFAFYYRIPFVSILNSIFFIFFTCVFVIMK
jgi:hypothetical protein